MEAVTQKRCQGAPSLRVISCEREDCQHFCDLFSLQFSHHHLPVPSALSDLIITLFLCHLNAHKQNNQDHNLVATFTFHIACLHHIVKCVFSSVLRFTTEH